MFQFQLESQEENYHFSFTASATFRAKLERARELASHAIPTGDVAQVLERALNLLIERELKRRLGTGKPRKQRGAEA